MPGEAGYIGIGLEEGVFVPVADAFAYALERCLSGTLEEQDEFKAMMKEWYYSGNWIKTEED